MKTTRMNTTPIKPTLQAMEVGQRTDFHVIEGNQLEQPHPI